MATTFERIQAPATPEAPEPHTPGPFVRYGVMVRDTIETTGGMFCIRPGRPIVNHAGRNVIEHGDVIGYAYTRADADLFAASAAMLEALRTLHHHAAAMVPDAMMYGGWFAKAAGIAADAISAAEGRTSAAAPTRKAVTVPSIEMQALRMGWQFDVQADEAGEWAWFREDPEHDDERAVRHGTGWRVYVESAYEAVAEGAR